MSGQKTLPEQQQEMPGTTAEMTPKPDHGEESYSGSRQARRERAIITGGDCGIGRAVAIAFAREGADVADLLPPTRRTTPRDARWVEQAGRSAVLVAGDIADPAHCRDVVERRVDRVRRLDILVNNAAYQAHLRGDRGDQRRGVGPDLHGQHPRHVLSVPRRRCRT